MAWALTVLPMAMSTAAVGAREKAMAKAAIPGPMAIIGRANSWMTRKRKTGRPCTLRLLLATSHQAPGLDRKKTNRLLGQPQKGIGNKIPDRNKINDVSAKPARP